MLVLIFIRFW